jgi:glucosamine--fructose-6-phosphate aminotransferase (isomerizing)
MLKEIWEQPQVFGDTLRAVTDAGLIRSAGEVTVAACGSSAHAAMVFCRLLESCLRIPARVVLGSEFRYSPPLLKGLVIGVSQSGETADTLAALKLAREEGCEVLAVTNVLGSSVERVSSAVIYTRAGPEVSVAATKSFTAQLAVFMQIVNLLSGSRFDHELSEVQRCLSGILHLDMTDAVSLCAASSDLFYIGRGLFYPVALEGALKMKEISYIHAEGYAAGELKHGPFSLLSSETPVIAVCVPDRAYPVMMSNLREIKARNAPLIAVGVAGDRDLEEISDVFLPMPAVSSFGWVVLSSVILQMLAYYTAVALDRDVDMPRNLAKSVTVE